MLTHISMLRVGVMCLARGVEQLKLSYESLIWDVCAAFYFFSLYFYTIEFPVCSLNIFRAQPLVCV